MSDQLQQLVMTTENIFIATLDKTLASHHLKQLILKVLHNAMVMKSKLKCNRCIINNKTYATSRDVVLPTRDEGQANDDYSTESIKYKQSTGVVRTLFIAYYQQILISTTQ